MVSSANAAQKAALDAKEAALEARESSLDAEKAKQDTDDRETVIKKVESVVEKPVTVPLQVNEERRIPVPDEQMISLMKTHSSTMEIRAVRMPLPMKNYGSRKYTNFSNGQMRLFESSGMTAWILFLSRTGLWDISHVNHVTRSKRSPALCRQTSVMNTR